MSNCTCTTDKQMTCIVHPTPVSLKERIAELEAEAENAKTYMVNLSKTVTEVVAENQRLRESLERGKDDDCLYLLLENCRLVNHVQDLKGELQAAPEGGGDELTK